MVPVHPTEHWFFWLWFFKLWNFRHFHQWFCVLIFFEFSRADTRFYGFGFSSKLLVERSDSQIQVTVFLVWSRDDAKLVLLELTTPAECPGFREHAWNGPLLSESVTKPGPRCRPGGGRSRFELFGPAGTPKEWFFLGRLCLARDTSRYWLVRGRRDPSLK